MKPLAFVAFLAVAVAQVTKEQLEKTLHNRDIVSNIVPHVNSGTLAFSKDTRNALRASSNTKVKLMYAFSEAAKVCPTFLVQALREQLTGKSHIHIFHMIPYKDRECIEAINKVCQSDQNKEYLTGNLQFRLGVHQPANHLDLIKCPIEIIAPMFGSDLAQLSARAPETLKRVKKVTFEVNRASLANLSEKKFDVPHGTELVISYKDLDSDDLAPAVNAINAPLVEKLTLTPSVGLAIQRERACLTTDRVKWDNFPKLSVLSLAIAEVNLEQIESLPGTLTSLEILTESSEESNEALDFGKLSHMKSLKRLSVRARKSLIQLHIVSGFNELEFLEVVAFLVKEEGAENLAQFPKLKHLTAGYVPQTYPLALETLTYELGSDTDFNNLHHLPPHVKRLTVKSNYIRHPLVIPGTVEEVEIQSLTEDSVVVLNAAVEHTTPANLKKISFRKISLDSNRDKLIQLIEASSNLRMLRVDLDLFDGGKTFKLPETVQNLEVSGIQSPLSDYKPKLAGFLKFAIQLMHIPRFEGHEVVQYAKDNLWLLAAQEKDLTVEDMKPLLTPKARIGYDISSAMLSFITPELRGLHLILSNDMNLDSVKEILSNAAYVQQFTITAKADTNLCARGKNTELSIFRNLPTLLQEMAADIAGSCLKTSHLEPLKFLKKLSVRDLAVDGELPHSIEELRIHDSHVSPRLMAKITKIMSLKKFSLFKNIIYSFEEFMEILGRLKSLTMSNVKFSKSWFKLKRADSQLAQKRSCSLEYVRIDKVEFYNFGQLEQFRAFLNTCEKLQNIELSLPTFHSTDRPSHEATLKLNGFEELKEVKLIKPDPNDFAPFLISPEFYRKVRIFYE